MRKEEFDPEKRHYQLGIDEDNVEKATIYCTRCYKVLAEPSTALSVTDMIFGQYRYIRENLPCKALEDETNE